MASTTERNAAILPAIDAVPFNPFRASGQGARGAYPTHFERVELASTDGTPLVGRIALHGDRSTRPAVILSHSLWQFKEIDALVDLATFYHGNGWNVLVIDFQGHGESAKLSDAPYTVGWKEGENAVGAARYLRGLGDEVGSIAVMGFSISAAAALLAAQADPEAIDVCLAVSPPAKQETHFIMSHIDKWLRLSGRDPVTYFEDAGRYYGISGADVRRNDETVDPIRTLKQPVLLLDMEDDDFIPLSDAAQIEAAARSNPNALVLTRARGGHGVEVVLNDRYWFKAISAIFLKAHQAPERDDIRTDVSPIVDAQLTIAPGWDGILLGTISLRNNGTEPVSNVTVSLPYFDVAPAYSGAPPRFGPLEREGATVSWHAESLPGRAAIVGPFTVALRIADIPTGTRLRTRVTVRWDGGDATSNETGFTVR